MGFPFGKKLLPHRSEKRDTRDTRDTPMPRGCLDFTDLTIKPAGFSPVVWDLSMNKNDSWSTPDLPFDKNLTIKNRDLIDLRQERIWVTPNADTSKLAFESGNVRHISRINHRILGTPAGMIVLMALQQGFLISSFEPVWHGKFWFCTRAILRSQFSVLSRWSGDGYWGTPPSPSPAGAHVAKQRWTWFLSTFFCIISRNKFAVGDSTWKSTEDIKNRHIITFFFVHVYIIYTYIYVQRVLCMCDNADHV